MRCQITTLLVLVPLALAPSGCQGPEARDRNVPLSIDTQALAIQWQDGPRREAAQAEMRRRSRDIANDLFVGDPMPSGMPAPPPEKKRFLGFDDIDLGDPGDDRPAWADGVKAPPTSLEHDLPRAWPIVVRRGETPAVLARWIGSDVRTILSDNTESLKGRKWLRTGDRLMLTMSANQKVAFDKARESFQQERLDAYFSKRFFEKVVVYRVKRGEFVSTAAKRYGDVPLWLLEEFNQTDFRGLKAGDEVLIPVVGTFEAGQTEPPVMRVVDEDGRPLADDRNTRVAKRMHNGLLGRARMALDDSNVFERGTGVFSPSSQALLPEYAAGPAEPQAAQPVHAGQPVYQPATPRPVAAIAGANAYPTAVPPRAPVVAPLAESRPVARDIIVKRGETLLHYTEWSGVTVDQIKVTNPRLDPDRILVGSRIALPLTDLQYVDFVKARSSWVSAKGGSPRGGAQRTARRPVAAIAAKPAASTRRYHTVASGDTASHIAHRHGVTVKALKRANGGHSLDQIRVGQKLRLP